MHMKSAILQWLGFVFNGICSRMFLSKQRMMKEFSLQQDNKNKWNIPGSPAAAQQLREGQVCHHG